MYGSILRNRPRQKVQYGRITAIAGLVALVGCSGPPPSRLFLLSSGPIQAPGERAMLSSGHLDPTTGSPPAGARAVAVAVTVPQYLDRPEIMVRTDDFELRPLPEAKWAEDLAMTASRALADDLNRLLPGYEIVAWPNRLQRPVAYRIEVNLSHFEPNSPTQVVVAGRWTITDDTTAKERASANFQNAAPLADSDPKLIVATMSNLLGGVSSDIAAELQKEQIVRRR